MSDIHDPAQPESPTAPGDQGNSSQPEPGNTGAPAGGPAAAAPASPGNEAAPASAAARPASDDEPPAPGNERNPASASHQDDEDDGPAPGNEAPASARGEEPALQYDEEESPEDSIGNRLDGPPTHQSNLGQLAAQGGPGGAPGGGQKRRDKRNKHKGGGGPQQGGERGPRPGGGGGNQKDADPNARRAFHVGDKVRAKIVTLGQAGAVVDLWGKEHGVIDLREVVTAENPEPKVGDGVDVVVVQDGSRGGNLVVTRDPSRADRARELVAQAFNNNEPIEGLITGVNRGGLEVDLSGIRAFCPSSQIDVRFPPTVNPKSLVLTRQLFKITSLVEETKEAIVSRRALLEADARARAEEARANIKVGQVVKGTVVAIKDYGVFVDLGGIEGLIHISELTHNRSARPGDVVKVGEEVEAKVLRISGGGPKPEPANAPPATAGDKGGAAEAAPHHAEAAEHGAEGEAAHAEAHGDEGSEGEAHAEGAEPSGAEGAEGATTAAAGAEGAAPQGARGEKKGAGGKDDKKGGKKGKHKGGRGVEGLPRVMLSRRAVEPDPWSGVEKKFPVGSVHAGKVARMQPFGAFIELSPGVDGLLHVSELGAGKRIEHPNEVLKEGQAVNVRVERVERGAKRISLSLVPEGVTEEQLKNAIVPRVGMVVKATVVEHDSIGIWAQIDGAIGKLGRGLIPPPESNQPRGTDLRRAIPIGTSVQVKVVEMDRGRLKLSIRAALHDEERQAYRAYQKEATSTRVGVSLADKLRGKLGGLAGGGTTSSKP